ncbi:MAG: hypothetical protein V4490_03325 [Pseudomonadota bacterium]
MAITKKVRQFRVKSEHFVNGRNAQERVLFFVLVVCSILLLWNNIIFSPIHMAITSNNFRVHELSSKLVENKTKIAAMVEKIKSDPLAEKRAHKVAMAKKLSLAKDTFTRMTADLISPLQMRDVLESVLSESGGVNIVSLTNTEAKRLVPSDPTVSLYSHAMNVKLSGEYFPVIAYLESLEKNKMKILWGSLTYTVTTYPKAEVMLLISTISDSEGWIGV